MALFPALTYYQKQFAIAGSPAMFSPEEKEQLQRIITEQNKILAAAPSFAAKRAAQKVNLDAMNKRHISRHNGELNKINSLP